jgi:hypothetical protein
MDVGMLEGREENEVGNVERFEVEPTSIIRRDEP